LQSASFAFVMNLSFLRRVTYYYAHSPNGKQSCLYITFMLFGHFCMLCVFRYLDINVLFSHSAFELQVCLLNSVQFSSVQFSGPEFLKKPYCFNNLPVPPQNFKIC